MTKMAAYVLVAATFLTVVGSLQATAAGAADAAGIYASRCAFCHGEKGAGDGMAGSALQPPPTDFTKAAYWKGTTMDQVRSGIAAGKPGTAMVGFGSTLEPKEIDALVELLNGFKPAE